MKPGPRIGAGGNADQRSFVEKANDAWSGAAPDWVLELAEYADGHRLKGAADKLSVSVALVSTTIGNKYQGDLARVEELVRGALMGAVVICPIKGEMTRDICLGWQAKPYALTSSARAEMYQACRNGCPHSKLKKGHEDAA